MPLSVFVGFFPQYVVKGSRRWFSRTRKEGCLFRLHLVLWLHQKWCVFLIYLSIRTCCISRWWIRPSEELTCQVNCFGFSIINSVSHWFWLHRYSFRCTWKMLEIKPVGFLKVCIVDIEMLIHIYFYKHTQTQVSPVTCAWGHLLGSLRSESCHQFPSWGQVICMGRSLCSEHLQRGNSTVLSALEANTAKCPLGWWPLQG